MKELSQIRMAVLDALCGAGIQAMEVFPEKQAMAYSGVVAAVGVGAASGKTAGFRRESAPGNLPGRPFAGRRPRECSCGGAFWNAEPCF